MSAQETTPHHAPTPRALRTMAVVRWALLGLVTLLAAYSVWTFWGSQQDVHAAHEEARYYCPMHPQIRSPEPGECPICHMNLESIPEERRSQPQPASSSVSAPPSAPSPSNVTPVTLSEEKQRAVGLATSAVESATLGDRLRVPAVISAPDTGLAQARVRAPGFVEQVAVRQTGVRVSRGQALAFVYSPEIYRAQEEYLAATRWSGAAKGDSSANAGAAELATAARHALQLLGLSAGDIEEITRTGKPIRAVAVRAPAGGFVTRFNAVLGSRAEPEMVLYEIADLSSVWLLASVHERDLGAVRVGMSASFTTSASQAEPLRARVELIEPTLEESTRTTRVRLVVPNREGRLRPGQFGEVEFELPASPGLFVPRDAVIRTGENEYVYVATSAERFEPRLVRVGPTREGRVQLLAGVSEGDRVVTRGSFMLDSESRLQASLAAAPAPASSARGASSEQGPSCETEFDHGKQAEKYLQCRACERQHLGMGRMVADCKEAIPRPWR
jgi:membrane fusion protein, copper/silver efflux system